MRPLLYLMAIVICEGARLPRGIGHHIPHFKAIYHGHGATSYQNVQIQSHGSVPIANNYVEHIDDHHSSNHLSHGSVSTENHYVEHLHDHHLSDHLHDDGIHEVQLILEVPAEHHDTEHYVHSAIVPYAEHDLPHYELKSPESSGYYIYNHHHEDEFH